MFLCRVLCCLCAVNEQTALARSRTGKLKTGKNDQESSLFVRVGTCVSDVGAQAKCCRLHNFPVARPHFHRICVRECASWQRTFSSFPSIPVPCMYVFRRRTETRLVGVPCQLEGGFSCEKCNRFYWKTLWNGRWTNVSCTHNWRAPPKWKSIRIALHRVR